MTGAMIIIVAVLIIVVAGAVTERERRRQRAAQYEAAGISYTPDYTPDNAEVSKNADSNVGMRGFGGGGMGG